MDVFLLSCRAAKRAILSESLSVVTTLKLSIEGFVNSTNMNKIHHEKLLVHLLRPRITFMHVSVKCSFCLYSGSGVRSLAPVREPDIPSIHRQKNSGLEQLLV